MHPLRPGYGRCTALLRGRGEERALRCHGPALPTIEDNEVFLPHDEIWVYDTESGLWQMHLTHGDLPPPMSGSCGACLNGRLYIFGGYDDEAYSNRLYYVDLRPGTGEFTWKQVKHFKGQPPTARDKLSCWVYKRQLIYFGGYGSRRHHELNDCFDAHDASREGQMFWGWSNDIHVFDTEEQAWIQPVVKSTPPQARAAHSCALLGNNGYVFGGRVLQTRMNDLHVLNLDTWTWSGGIRITGETPHGRSWHTLTPVGDDQLFLYGGLSVESVPLSDGWIFNLHSNVWTEFKRLPKDQPRLWHTACPGRDHEVMVFGGSKDDLLSLDTGHCNDLLIFQTQPLPLLRLCLDSIGKNAYQFRNQLSCLPQKLLQQVRKRITFWAASRFRQSRRDGHEIKNNAPVRGFYDFYLPRDEIWIYDMVNGVTWQRRKTKGAVPPSMSGSCATFVDGVLYLFGGHHAHGNTNMLFMLNLNSRDGDLFWERIEYKGPPPSPKDKLGVWVYRYKLIYFGGYGYYEDDPIGTFEYDETSFGNIGLPRGWNNHVHALHLDSFTWHRIVTTGKSPSPRAAHACASVGNRGYVFGGRYRDSRMNDLYYLNFDTWEWHEVIPQGVIPVGRSWHSLTRASADTLFLFGGFTTDKQPLSDTWIYSIKRNEWIPFQSCHAGKPRLWHTACASKEGEIFVFGGCANNLLAHHKAAHSNAVLVFSVQPRSLLRLSLETVISLKDILSDSLDCLPKHLLHDVHQRVASVNTCGS